MFNLGSTADTLPLPGVGKTTMKLVFPLKGKLATCITGKKIFFAIIVKRTCNRTSFFYQKPVVPALLDCDHPADGGGIVQTSSCPLKQSFDCPDRTLPLRSQADQTVSAIHLRMQVKGKPKGSHLFIILNDVDLDIFLISRRIDHLFFLGG